MAPASVIIIGTGETGQGFRLEPSKFYPAVTPKDSSKITTALLAPHPGKSRMSTTTCQREDCTQ
jgi:hypothetical protein